MKLYKSILCICVAIFIASFLGEGVIRIYYHKKMSDNTLVLNDGILVYTHKPSIKFINRYGIEIQYNSLGFIGKEISPKGEGVFRILGIGDSITAATYLPESERYLNRVTAILSKKIKRHIEIINAGVGGYNTWQELELIQTTGLSVKPDLIIVGVCLNDFVHIKPRLEKGLFGSIRENYRDGSRARHFDFIYQRSDLYKFLYDFLSNLRRSRYGKIGYRRYLQEYNFDIKLEDFEEWRKPFLDMMSLAKMHNIKILFVIFPLESQIVKGEDEACGRLSDFLEKNDAHYLDLMKYFKDGAVEGESLFRRRDIAHPMALGHHLAAKAISSYIIDNKILE